VSQEFTVFEIKFVKPKGMRTNGLTELLSVLFTTSEAKNELQKVAVITKKKVFLRLC